MAELKALLIALIKGSGSFEAASARLDELLRRSPALAPDCRRMLHAARRAGLAESVYSALDGQIPRAAARELPTDIALGQAAAGADADITMLATDDPDVTLLGAGEADRTLLPGPDTPSVAAPDGDDTMHGPPGAQTQLDPPATRETTELPRSVEGRETRSGARGLSPEEDTRVNPNAGPNEITDLGAVEPGTGPEGVETFDDGVIGAESTIGRSGEAIGAQSLGVPLDDDEFDILDEDSRDPDSRSAPSTGADWATNIDAQSSAGVSREFRENDRLRNRFELISKLGEGGMGAVWKGRDLLKVEARDRNPFVAIKLLQGDFKEHPEAFIALQRETSKQQRLAHPNIATVYDFDRDDATQTVFMTMEVLEGQPLDSFVRKLPAEGLPPEEAMPLIEQLGAGLGYAHTHGLVHSDLKPGNCFVTHDDAVKLLDFGIARASKTKSDAEGETTLFDPGQLGALTPTYATLEMFDGKDPDPRDDIYALAIMAYQLLSGRHPYGKKSAPKALELGLTPAPIDKLTKRQNRGLARALAFHRDDRTPSVEEFLEDIQPRQGRGLIYAGIGIAAAVAIAALSVGPISGYVNERQRDEIAAVCAQGGIVNIRACIARIQEWDDPEQRELLFTNPLVQDSVVEHIARGDEKSITEALQVLAAFDPESQKDIRQAPVSRDAILELYQRRVHEVFAPDEGRFDYDAARKIVGALEMLYRDSARVQNVSNELEEERQSQLSALSDQYNELFDAGLLVARAREEDIGDVLGRIRDLDPQHRLLTDERLRYRFAELADAALESGELGHARDLLEASEAYVPHDPALDELRFEVETELTRLANSRRVTLVQDRLEGELASLTTLADFQRVRADLLVLADLSPGNALLGEIRENLEAAFSRELGERIGAGDFAGGERLVRDFARLLEIGYLTGQRAMLSAAERDAGFSLEEDAERLAAIESRRRAVETLLAEPELSAEWELRLRAPYKELVALLDASDSRLEPIRQRTAAIYLDRAASARASGRFAEAAALVEKGAVFYPDYGGFEAERQRIADARSAVRRQRAEEQRRAGIRSAKAEFRAKAENDQVAEARAVLARLAGERLDADDTFLTVEAPALLGAAYARLARARARGDEILDALALARAGLSIAPELPELLELAAEYEAEAARRARELTLRTAFDAAGPLDVGAIRLELTALRQEDPERYAALEDEFAGVRARQVENLAQARSLALDALRDRLVEYESLFPDRGEALRDQAARILADRLATAAVDEPSRIAGLAAPLDALRRLDAERHAQVTAALARRSAAAIETRAGRSRGDAYGMLIAARKTFGDHEALGALSSLRPPPRQLQAAVEAIDAGQLTAARRALEDARDSDPRHPDLAAIEARLATAERRARGAYAAYAAQVKASRTPRDQRRFDAEYAAIGQQWSDNPEFKRLVVRRPQKGECTTHLAGFGTRRGGTCYDLIGKRKGPEMVVVPAGGAVDTEFAIGKYEVTVADYNLFCSETGSCEPRSAKERRLPITGITLADAERYAAWLSARASSSTESTIVYRLPTVAEWEYAALAGGAQPEKKFNCRVTSGADIIAGHSLVDARSGRPNGWGLTNYVGNAQEWVRAGAAVVARGGAFEDPLAKCEPSISRSHSGGADEVTGFRLVRELG